jgi:hypothetical protein
MAARRRRQSRHVHAAARSRQPAGRVGAEVIGLRRIAAISREGSCARLEMMQRVSGPRRLPETLQAPIADNLKAMVRGCGDGPMSTLPSPTPQIAAANLSPLLYAPLYSAPSLPDEGTPGLRPTWLCGRRLRRLGSSHVGWPSREKDAAGHTAGVTIQNPGARYRPTRLLECAGQRCRQARCASRKLLPRTPARQGSGALPASIRTQALPEFGKIDAQEECILADAGGSRDLASMYPAEMERLSRRARARKRRQAHHAG